MPAGRPTDTPVIYGLIDPRDGRVRYVGKANDVSKRLKTHMLDSRRRSTPLYSWIKKLSSLGLSPSYVVLHQCGDGEDWRVEEKRIIAEYRKSSEDLLNLADGGDGAYCSTETRRQNAKNMNAKRNDELWRLKCALGQALKRGHVSEKTKAKMRARMDVFGQFAEYL